MTEIEKLLKVLDMSHNEQAVWCEKPKHGNRQMGQSLADLAFRLRDEAKLLTTKGGYSLWYKAKIEVFNYEFEKDKTRRGTDAFWEYDTKEIHFIVRALIAKQLAEENND